MDPKPFLRSHWPSLVLGGTGTVSFVSGLLVSPSRGGFATALVILGVGSLALSAFAPRIKEWEMGPVKAKLTDQHQVEESSRLLTGPENLPAESESPEEDELVIWARTALAGEAIFSLLRPADDSDLATCRLSLYLFDQEQELLVPVVRAGDPAPSPLESFRPGCGATGTAWARGEWVVVYGPAVADATHGLTPEQQEHFQDLTAVASLPIFNASGRVLGVLSASSREPDGPERLTGEDGYYDLLSRTFTLARVLVDLLKWFDDGYDHR